MQPQTSSRKKPLQAMLSLMRQNLSCYIGSMIATAMIVLIGFLTPIVLAETIDSVLGTNPSTLPAFVLAPIRAMGGRQFLVEHLWILGLVLV
ncbi:MAG: hypothetical protein ACI4MJ_12465, partial [Aristaeellaceae bacterium]